MPAVSYLEIKQKRKPAKGVQARLLGCFLVLFLAACGVPQIDPQEEVKIGARLHPKIIEEYGGVYNDARVKAYVESVMQRIANASDDPNQAYRITVLDTPIVNAFALPGGYTYVTRGLLALANNEAELAGVIGHEISHVTARHSVKRQSTAQGTAVLAAVLGAVVSSASGVDVGLTQDLINIGGGALLAGYSREQEYEADNLGIAALARAGYEPHAQADFLESLGRYAAYKSGRDGKSSTGWFDSHPNTRERVEKASEKADAKKLPTSTQVNASRYLSVIDGLLYGDGVEQGVVNGRRFSHPDLRISFKVPPGFQLTNSADKVTAEHRVGVKIIFDVASIPKGLGLAEYVNDIWGPTGHVGRTQKTTINRRKAAMGKVKTKEGVAHLLAIDYEDGKVFRFGVIAPSGQQSNAESAFASLRQNINFLSEAAAEAIKPLRLSIITVQAGDSIASLSRLMADGGSDKQSLFMVLNGLKNGDVIEPGQRLKLIAN